MTIYRYSGLLIVWLLLLVGPVVRYPVAAQEAPPACPTLTADLPYGETARTLDSGGLERSYLLYVPESYDGTQAVPLVFNFHGFASNPAQQRDFAGWNAIADEEPMIVVYPQGTGFPARWYAGYGFAAPEEVNAVDDVGFVVDLIATLSDEFCLDPARVFASGLSNGGGMSYRLACELGDQIAAIGTVAGAYTEQPTACEPGRPLPVISFHGQEDPVVPYEGTDILNAFEAWGAAWAERNGCATEPNAFSVTGQVSGLRYTGCEADATVELYTLADGGHTWPGSPVVLPEFIAGKTSYDIDATRLMWAFFQAHPLPERE